VFAIENHADYRSGDLLQLLEMVDRASLQIQLDTGNAFAVAEEPVDAARALAPYVVSTHIKDMTIRPLTDPARHGEWCKVLGSGIGEGDVDIPAIARILQENAPDPDTLPFCLEIEPPPGSDHIRLCKEGVAFVNKNLAGIVKSAS
jgi:sugar phosphate isomerase/epimerase